MRSMMRENSGQQLPEVIADFLEMGHVDNIIAMFRQDPSCLLLSGALIQDERFKVRMGMAVLFEELVAVMPPEGLDSAVPSLLAAMQHDASYIRGDAAYVLATIKSPNALRALAQFQQDPDPQIAEIACEALGLGPRHNELC
jgi:hypothetical protein